MLEYLQVLFYFIIFSLAELLNVTIMRNFDIMFEQTLIHSVCNSVILCIVIHL
jgi:hypothetical protein